MNSVYKTEVFWSDDDEGFIAIAPDLPGCSAFGETRSDASAQIDRAIDAWIEAQQTAGNPIPEPTQHRAPNEFSGRILLRLSKSLHCRLHESAKSDGVSVNAHICHLLAGNQAALDVTKLWQEGFSQRSKVLVSHLSPSKVYEYRSDSPTIVGSTTARSSSDPSHPWSFSPDRETMNA